MSGSPGRVPIGSTIVLTALLQVLLAPIARWGESGKVPRYRRRLRLIGESVHNEPTRRLPAGSVDGVPGWCGRLVVAG